MKNTIYLDAGHSEVDPGAVVANDRFEYESQINIAIRDALIPLLERNGFNVEAVPDELNLNESYNWVNNRTSNIGDGLALSIHCNCCGGEGAESYAHSHFESSMAIARMLIDEFCKTTGIKNRGAKSDSTTRFGALSWIRKTNVWATLIECGFLDNNKDMDIIIENIDKVAEGLARGVCKIYGVEYNKSIDEKSPLSREEKKELAIKIIREL